MELELKGKRALVTGSTKGIGEIIAKTLAQEGVAVVIHGRQRKEALQVVDEITQAGGKAAIAIGDLATDKGAADVGCQAVNAYDGIDILVNNAGGFDNESWFKTSADVWVNIYNQNVGSMVRMIQHLVPNMKERGWGRVISISSLVSAMPLPEQASYSASKSANVNLAVSLAKELAGTRITSNAISPGPILTEGFKDFALARAKQEGWVEDLAAIEHKWATEVVPNPTGRIGRPEDIANAVAFLASPKAGFINGANLRVDGGTVPTIN